ncbi:MAG: sulfatase-like hydrolase/transferase [Planctomycetota bacterium]
MKPLLLFASILWLSATLVLASQTLADAPPNIILVLSDDQGWNALSTPMDPQEPRSGSDFHQTPNLDRLCKEGMRFTQAYSSGSQCMPTRNSILFGVSTTKSRMWENGSKPDQRLFDDPEQTLPQVIKNAKGTFTYKTAHFGKWHIKERTPEQCGYDESDGPTDNKDGSLPEQTKDPKAVNGITSRAIDFMKRQHEAGNPFYVQLSHYATHVEFLATPDMESKYDQREAGERHKNRIFAAMNEDLDRGVGKLLDAIDAMGIGDNTYVFYTSDNGYPNAFVPQGARHHGAWPLSYHKTLCYEGGVRVPLIVRGPGIRANAVSNVPIVTHDLMRTFAELVGSSALALEQSDGGSFASVLKNEGIGKVARAEDFLVFHGKRGDTSIRRDNLKLMFDEKGNLVGLFNLANDPSEERDVSKEHPEATIVLTRTLRNYFEKCQFDKRIRKLNVGGKKPLEAIDSGCLEALLSN